MSTPISRLERAWQRYAIVLRYSVERQAWSGDVIDTYAVDNAQSKDTFALKAGFVCGYSGARREDAVDYCCKQIAAFAETIDEQEGRDA